jgi:RHS repeat-associated protein
VREAAVVVSGSPAAPQTSDYDPYGNPIQTPPTAPLTDFRYAGMFYHADSGLYMTQYRVYDPRTARWISRDPISERTLLKATLAAYHPLAGGWSPLTEQ